MLSKKLAKRAAALLGCKLLHKIGELDDNLNPRSHETLGDDVSHLFHHWPEVEETDSGIHKKKRVHMLKVGFVCKVFRFTTKGFFRYLKC